MGFKFKKGSKVEVWNRYEMPMGCWCCAEIASCNGLYYNVRYDPYLSDNGVAVERVPRKSIRPCPPASSRKSWVPGNIVEVFDNSSWKLAEVSDVVGGNCYLVRLLGSSMVFEARSSELRLQQSWLDDKWSVIDEDLMKSEYGFINKKSKEGKLSYQMPQPHIEVKPGDNHFPTNTDNGFKERPRDLSRGIKRKPRVSSPLVETCTEAKKLRAIEEEGSCQRLVAQHAPKLQKKVDAVASPRTLLGEKYMHASLNNRTVFSEKDMGRKIPTLEPSDSERICSSVGSNSPYRSVHPENVLTEHLDSDSDDAGTSFEPGSEPSLPAKEARSAEIHRLELHAYRKTLVALHASGPISWEREALMTNLRDMLHISNDEHLLELRNLLSVKTDVTYR